MKNWKFVLLGVVILAASCSRSARKSKRNGVSETKVERPIRKTGKRSSKGNTIIGRREIKLREESGVQFILVKLNGVQMDFILDTGASTILISSEEADRLYKMGKLTAADSRGSAEFSDASGNVSQGAIVNIKRVEVGGIVLRNVEAAISENSNAPLLFGQTALSRFGKVSVDYDRNVLILE